MGSTLSIILGLAAIVAGSIMAAVVVTRRKKDNQAALDKNPKAKQESVFGYWPVVFSFVAIGVGTIVTIIGIALKARERRQATAAPRVAVRVQAPPAQAPPAFYPYPPAQIPLYQAPAPAPAQYQTQAPPIQVSAQIQPAVQPARAS